VHLSEPELKTQGFLDLAEKLARETPESFYVRQFTNQENPRSHYDSTGPEIWSQTQGDVDIFVAGVGTGGTIVGVGQYLKEMKPTIEVVAVEPSESRVLQGECHRVHALVGIGTGLLVPIIENLAPGEPSLPGGRGIIDEFVSSSSSESLDMSLLLAKRHGLLVGPSSGASVYCALELGVRPENHDKTIVAICASSGVRYLQHPMFKGLRDEANAALSKKRLPTVNGHLFHRGTPNEPDVNITPIKRIEDGLIQRVKNAILELSREILKKPNLRMTDNLVACGANSMTGMLLLGKARQVLEDCGVGSDVKGLKLQIVKELLWGTVEELSFSLLGVDEFGFVLPQSDRDFTEKLVIQYCGG